MPTEGDGSVNRTRRVGFPMRLSELDVAVVAAVELSCGEPGATGAAPLDPGAAGTLPTNDTLAAEGGRRAGFTRSIETESFCPDGSSTVKYLCDRFTTRRGPIYGDSRGRITPAWRRVENDSLAALSLSGGSGRGLEKVGGALPVSMVCLV